MTLSSMPAAERLTWTPAAWEDTIYWQGQDRKQLHRINQLIQACRYHYR
jgi:Txe/YoeB family toxin of Txe-Axe toxin-antitoxin module